MKQNMPSNLFASALWISGGLASVTVPNDVGGRRSTSFDTTATDSNKECPLNCLNGGSCAMMTAEVQSEEQQLPFAEVREAATKWYCDCPDSHVGELCETQSRQLATTCGTLQCQNGGQCAVGQNYNVETPLCDCSTAFQIVGNKPPFDLERYVGRDCTTEVLQSDYCASGDEDLFCVNNGTCRTQAVNFAQQPCRCKDGFTGRHCEYRDEHVQPQCVLTCSGNGKCVHGINPEKGAQSKLDLAGQGTNNFMYCACDEGFAGANCEFDYIKCNGRGRYCFHGSQCVPVPNGGGLEQCVCVITTDKKVAGQFCQYHATDQCENPTELTNTEIRNLFTRADKITLAQVPFCVNDGECIREENTNDYYCACDKDEYVGRRCEHKNIPTMPPAQALTPAPTAVWTDTFAPTDLGSVTDAPTDGPTRRSPLTDAPTSRLTHDSSPSPSATEFPSISLGPSFSSGPSVSEFPSITLEPSSSSSPEESSVTPTRSPPKTTPAPSSKPPTLRPTTATPTTSPSTSPSSSPTTPFTLVSPQEGENVIDPLVTFEWTLVWNPADINRVVYQIEYKDETTRVWTRLFRDNVPVAADGVYEETQNLVELGGPPSAFAEYKWRILVDAKPRTGFPSIKTDWVLFNLV